MARWSMSALCTTSTWRGWPIGPWVATYIIGELFVSNIASKTLRTLKQHIESHDALAVALRSRDQRG